MLFHLALSRLIRARSLMIFVILSCAFACQPARLVSLTSATEVLTAPDTEGSPSAPVYVSRTPALSRALAVGAGPSSLWVQWTIEAGLFSEPTLYLKDCRNIRAVAVNGQVLYRAQARPRDIFNFANSKHPFVVLPHSPLKTIDLLLAHSPRSGLLPDCTDLIVGDENEIIRAFTTTHLPELLVGSLLLLLGIIGLVSCAFRRSFILLTCSLFYLTLSGSFILNNPLLQFVRLNNVELFVSWNIFALATPWIYMLFLNAVIDNKSRSLLAFATVNLVLATLSLSCLCLGISGGSETIRLIAFGTFLLQLAFVLPRIASHYRHSVNIHRRAFWIGMGSLNVGILIDGIAYIAIGETIHAATVAGFAYALGTIISIAEERFFSSRRLHAEDKSHLEEYKNRLASEVTLRETTLSDKNRLFEASNIDLEEKNVLLGLAHRRVDELLRHQGTLIRKAAPIRTSIIPELIEGRNAAASTGLDRKALRSVSLTIHKLASVLDPFARLHESNAALINKAVWILVADKKNEAFFRHSLSSSSVFIRKFETPSECQKRFTSECPDLWIVGAEHADMITAVHVLHPGLPIILAGEGDLSKSIDFLRVHDHLNHLVSQAPTDAIFHQRNLLVTSNKILSNDIFGIEKYLDWGVDIKEAIITGNQARAAALARLDSDLEKSGISSALTRKAHHLADELLMNAIYDAPLDPQTGLSRYNHLSRAVSVELDATEYARFRYAYDGAILALSIDDPFGALERGVILKYLKACFEGKFGTINETEGKGGGGMGLFQIMTSADLLATNVRRGKKTEIIALLKVHDRSPSKGQFHYFTER